MPMMLWSLEQARQGGFAVDEQLLADMQQQVVTRLESKLPQGDKIKLVTDDGSILVWSLAQGQSSARTRQLLEKYVDLFVRVQQPEGFWRDPSLHWKETSSQVKDGDRGLDPYPPLIESDALKTTWTLLAGSRVRKEQDAWVQSRDRALTWLAKTPPQSQQELALRMIALRECGQANEAKRLLPRLLKQQHADGGWAQVAGGESDALATGQALVAIEAAGQADAGPVVRRAWDFLLKSQREDGSWFVPTRNKGKPQASDSGYVTTYYGTGWAVIGLVRSLPRE
jgi:hypothetical protein